MTQKSDPTANVRSAVRALRIFEAFAAEGGPMTLTQLALRLEMPASSCLLLIRTMLNRGYLYATGQRNEYYPTQRLAEVARRIAANDPLIQRVQPHLDRLRDATRETVALSKRQDNRLIYLAVAESPEVIRATMPLGTLRQLYITANGRALLAAMSEADRNRILSDVALERFTDRSIVSVDRLKSVIAEVEKQGFAVNSGESVPNLSAVATTVELNGETYAISIMGPSYRVDKQAQAYGELLLDYRRILKDQLSGDTAVFAPKIRKEAS